MYKICRQPARNYLIICTNNRTWYFTAILTCQMGIDKNIVRITSDVPTGMKRLMTKTIMIIIIINSPRMKQFTKLPIQVTQCLAQLGESSADKAKG